ncbi:MAG: PilT/PilU family type 4a pilus ATPase [Syntrophomonadaceae bacterium]|jgi:twitching motility protein PilT|nr:PilT/PilU family type 4a pilus ATPase [Syntrophomonadaceae bacterium]
MQDVVNMLTQAVQRQVSDIFITSGSPIIFKINGEMVNFSAERLMPKETADLIENIFNLTGDEHAVENFKTTGDCDLSFSLPGIGRFRINVFRQRNSTAAVIRVVQLQLANIKDLGIPDVVIDLYKRTQGLILVTGPAGSGKSTTLASLINLINNKRSSHIITLEDPIEYLHSHRLSIVNQREVGSDTASYAKALRATLRQAPDVILVGEMRDLETMSVALTAAETGHLILSSLHTVGAAKTIDRIIDIFPSKQQQQIRIQLSTVLKAVISQQLLPSPVKGMVAAFEVMISNSAIRNLIREGKTYQIDNIINQSAAAGMITMDMSIIDLFKKGWIEKEEVLTYCVNPDSITRFLS